MSGERSRRRFLRLAAGGAVMLPGVLRAQASLPDAPPDSTGGPGLDTLRYQGSIPYLQPGSLQTPKTVRVPKGRGKKPPDPPMLRPRSLHEGSVIALVAPASGLPGDEVRDSAERLRKLGFSVKMGKYLTSGFGYLAGTDEQRAGEFMRFVCDPEVECIMAVRGGYGVMRILPLLDFNEIRDNPKVIIGYSDITALVNPIHQRSRLIAFHGPVASSTFDPYTLDSFRRTAMSPRPAGVMRESEEFSGTAFSDRKAVTITGGRARGRLVGGNLSLVAAMMGTPYDIDTTGMILFLEEIEEEPYRIDRMLTQLALGGKLSVCAGLALGRFTRCDPKSENGVTKISLSLEQVIRGIMEPLNIPTVYGLPIGHVKSKMTLPVGALATLDADARTLTIEEPAVL